MTRVRELSPRGAGGVSVLRVEGPGALERVSDLVGELSPTAGPALVRVRAAGEDLDEALCVVLSGECVELHLHGSPPLVERVRASLAGDVGGATSEPAAPEPATLETRAADRLPTAPCEAGARILLDQTQGALRRDLEALAAQASPTAFQASLEALLERGRVAAPALAPARIVLAGPPNAGKSTLFNALFGRRRVVVSAQAGTTRDVVAERALLGAYAVDLFDTAGERTGVGPGLGGQIEAEGMDLGRTLRGTADLVFWLCPADGAPDAVAPPAGAVLLRSRVDLEPAPAPVAEPAAEPAAEAEWPPAPASLPGLSALTDPEGAVSTCAASFRARLGLPLDPWEPGAGVPFDSELRASLEALRGSGEAAAETAERRAAVAALLQR